MGSQVTWSKEIVEFAPFCLRRHRDSGGRPVEEGLLLEVLVDWWDEEVQYRYVRLRVVKTGKEIVRTFHWVENHCEKLNAMEALAWTRKCTDEQ